MSKKLFIPQNLRPWIEAQHRFHLSHAQVQMARELGMNPRKFGKLNNHKQERWKLPLPLFIEKCYRKRFGREQPEDARPLEADVSEKAAKKAAKKAADSPPVRTRGIESGPLGTASLASPEEGIECPF